MLPKPKHLGVEYAVQFQDQSIVDAYQYRPPYPDELFEILLALITDEPRAVLDLGCGRGDVARELVAHVERVDAVDFSHFMLARGKQLPHGDHPQLHWIFGRVEDVALHPPYALITAGESFHWFAWDVVIPRLHNLLTPHGYLALFGREAAPNPWNAAVMESIRRFATNKDFQPYSTLEELQKRNLFALRGTKVTAPYQFVQSVEDYIESFHSRNGFSRERMGVKQAAAFDAELQHILAPYQIEGKITLQVSVTVNWGKPAASVVSSQ